MFAVFVWWSRCFITCFAQDILKVGSEGFGILRAAPAIGGLLTMLIATSIPLHQKAGKSYY